MKEDLCVVIQDALMELKQHENVLDPPAYIEYWWRFNELRNIINRAINVLSMGE